MAVSEQVHDKFKVFVGSSVEELDSQVRAFTGGGTIAAKSIGVEFLESKGKLVLSLGYQEGAGYATKLLSRAVGVLDAGSEASLRTLETSLAEVASTSGSVICHELYVTGSGEVTAVFLAHSL
jgi:hypothetical protein